MSFAEGARVEVVNEYENKVRLYYYVDYGTYPSMPPCNLRFPAPFRTQAPPFSIVLEVPPGFARSIYERRCPLEGRRAPPGSDRGYHATGRTVEEVIRYGDGTSGGR
jgi:hypothetical protein